MIKIETNVNKIQTFGNRMSTELLPLLWCALFCEFFHFTFLSARYFVNELSALQNDTIYIYFFMRKGIRER